MILYDVWNRDERRNTAIWFDLYVDYKIDINFCCIL